MIFPNFETSTDLLSISMHQSLDPAIFPPLRINPNRAHATFMKNRPNFLIGAQCRRERIDFICARALVQTLRKTCSQRPVELSGSSSPFLSLSVPGERSRLPRGRTSRYVPRPRASSSSTSLPIHLSASVAPRRPPFSPSRISNAAVAADHASVLSFSRPRVAAVARFTFGAISRAALLSPYFSSSSLWDPVSCWTLVCSGFASPFFSSLGKLRLRFNLDQSGRRSQLCARNAFFKYSLRKQSF